MWGWEGELEEISEKDDATFKDVPYDEVMTPGKATYLVVMASCK